MKVLFCIRPDYKVRAAGDSVQMLTMAGYLKKHGIGVFINDGCVKDYSEYDIIHLFNLTRISETYRYFKMAQISGKPIVLTPIYWNLKKYYTYAGSDIQLNLWDMNTPFRREIIYGCSMLYPSSFMEQLSIRREFGSDIPCTVIYNCISEDLFEKPMPMESDESPYVFCSARICPRKNQFKLAFVCRELGIKLFLAGDAAGKEYLGKCLEYKNVRYLGFLQGNELIRLYKGAQLHALASFVETPGLSSLEAGACGCNILSTIEGSTEEYFGNLASYCDPYDDASLYNAVKNAMSSSRQPMLQEHIRQSFNTEKCLEPLYKSYCKLLERF